MNNKLMNDRFCKATGLEVPQCGILSLIGVICLIEWDCSPVEPEITGIDIMEISSMRMCLVGKKPSLCLGFLSSDKGLEIKDGGKNLFFYEKDSDSLNGYLIRHARTFELKI